MVPRWSADWNHGKCSTLSPDSPNRSDGRLGWRGNAGVDRFRVSRADGRHGCRSRSGRIRVPDGAGPHEQERLRTDIGLPAPASFRPRAPATGRSLGESGGQDPASGADRDAQGRVRSAVMKACRNRSRQGRPLNAGVVRARGAAADRETHVCIALQASCGLRRAWPPLSDARTAPGPADRCGPETRNASRIGWLIRAVGRNPPGPESGNSSSGSSHGPVPGQACSGPHRPTLFLFRGSGSPGVPGRVGLPVRRRPPERRNADWGSLVPVALPDPDIACSRGRRRMVPMVPSREGSRKAAGFRIDCIKGPPDERIFVA